MKKQADRYPSIMPGWCREIHDECFGRCELEICQVHDIHGKPCVIVGGAYWGTYGVSNFWDWQEVLPDGLGPRQGGYGGDWPKLADSLDSYRQQKGGA